MSLYNTVIKSVDSIAFLRRLCCLLILNPLSFSLMGQDNQYLPPVASSYAIVNATIIPSPGDTIAEGTVVVKGGLITYVGASASAPKDAVVVDADSMYVYAGFIDGFSHVGVASPLSDDNNKVEHPGTPPPDVAGIMPQRSVSDFLSLVKKDIENLRNVGFSVAQVVPYGAPMPGTSAIILLGESRTVDEMMLVPKSTFYSKLSGSGNNVYPATVMGVMAKWRELYRQAMQSQSYEAMYRVNAKSIPRPQLSQTLASFYPLINRKLPALFHVEKVLPLQRALSLSKEFDFKIILANVKQGWPVADKIKASKASVFLSLDLPKEIKSDKTKDSVVVDENKKRLMERQKEALSFYENQANLFTKKGIPYGFSTMGVKPEDIKGNLERMIASGLKEVDALAALTIMPARILGLDKQLGTIELGKIANLVITDRPYFEKKAKVIYTFVEGKRYLVQEDSGKEGDENAEPEGRWSYKVETPEGGVRGIMNLNKKDDGDYEGTITNSYSNEKVDVSSVSLEGDTVTFEFVIKVEGQIVEIAVDAKIEGETMEGSLVIEEESYPLSGEKEGPGIAN